MVIKYKQKKSSIDLKKIISNSFQYSVAWRINWQSNYYSTKIGLERKRVNMLVFGWLSWAWFVVKVNNWPLQQNILADSLDISCMLGTDVNLFKFTLLSAYSKYSYPGVYTLCLSWMKWLYVHVLTQSMCVFIHRTFWLQ